MSTSDAISHLKTLILLFKIYCGFESNKISAKEIVVQLEIEHTFHEKCFIHRKKHFDENFNYEITYSIE